MAATEFQAEILKRIARSRIDGGATYVAGGLALNHMLAAPRVSHDIDVFNDTAEAVSAAFERDTATLRAALDAGSITFHEGRIGGAWPRIVER